MVRLVRRYEELPPVHQAFVRYGFGWLVLLYERLRADKAQQ